MSVRLKILICPVMCASKGWGDRLCGWQNLTRASPLKEAAAYTIVKMANPNAKAMLSSVVVFPMKHDPGTTFVKEVSPPAPEAEAAWTQAGPET